MWLGTGMDQLLTDLRHKTKGHGGRSWEGVPRGDTETVPRLAGTKLGKAKLSWS